MSQMLVIDNAIGWAHLRLRGGWRNLLAVGGVAAALAAALWLLVPRIFGISQWNFATVMLNGTLGLEILLWVILIPHRIGAAVKADVASRMMESHRLMPITAVEAIVGYLLGPPSVLLATALVAAAAGAFAAASLGIAVDRYLLALFLIASLGGLVAVVSLFCSFVGKIGAAVGLIIFVPMLFAHQVIGTVLPPLVVLSGPFMRKTVFSMQAGSDLLRPYVICEIAQFSIGALFFAAAARRYRRPERAGFTPLMGLLLLLIWLAISWTGIVHWSEFAWRRMYFEEADAIAQWLACGISGLMLALLPLAATARLENAAALARRLQTAAPSRRTVPGPLLALLAAAAIAALPVLCLHITASDRRVPMTFLIFAAFLLQMYFLLRITTRLGSGSILLTVWVLIVLAGPVIAGLIAIAMADNSPRLDEALPGALCAGSPLGALIQLWTGGTANRQPGIAFLIALTVAAAGLFLGSLRKKRTTAQAHAA